MAAVTVMIWGTTFVATKVLIKYGLSPVDILFYRFLLAYICIWFFSPRVLLAKSWQDELRFVGLGLCGGSLYFVAENTALGMTLASNVSLIICTTPILTALLAPFFYKGDKLKARLGIRRRVLRIFFCLKAFVFKGFEALKIFLVLGGCMKL